MQIRCFHTWHFPFVRESHLLFKEQKDNDSLDELLEVAERTHGTMEADNVDALRDRTEKLVQDLDAAKNEKLGFWRQIGRLFVSKDKVKRNRRRRKKISGTNTYLNP